VEQLQKLPRVGILIVVALFAFQLEWTTVLQF
jgi:hypothetical protein